VGVGLTASAARRIKVTSRFLGQHSHRAVDGQCRGRSRADRVGLDPQWALQVHDDGVMSDSGGGSNS
jgi:hypothetical protein